MKLLRKKKFYLQRHLDDLLVLSGAGLIVYATSLLSAIAALYVAGAVLIVFGVLIGLGMEDK
jgi:hypothetical protein